MEWPQALKTQRGRVVAVALAALLILAWALRFDYIKADSRAFYKVNRWTGTTYLCLPAGCREVPDR